MFDPSPFITQLPDLWPATREIVGKFGVVRRSYVPTTHSTQRYLFTIELKGEIVGHRKKDGLAVLSFPRILEVVAWDRDLLQDRPFLRVQELQSSGDLKTIGRLPVPPTIEDAITMLEAIVQDGVFPFEVRALFENTDAEWMARRGREP